MLKFTVLPVGNNILCQSPKFVNLIQCLENSRKI